MILVLKYCLQEKCILGATIDNDHLILWLKLLRKATSISEFIPLLEACFISNGELSIRTTEHIEMRVLILEEYICYKDPALEKFLYNALLLYIREIRGIKCEEWLYISNIVELFYFVYKTQSSLDCMMALVQSAYGVYGESKGDEEFDISKIILYRLYTRAFLDGPALESMNGEQLSKIFKSTLDLVDFLPLTWEMNYLVMVHKVSTYCIEKGCEDILQTDDDYKRLYQIYISRVCNKLMGICNDDPHWLESINITEEAEEQNDITTIHMAYTSNKSKVFQ